MKNLLISVSPHVSGPYTFYKNLEKGLKKYGWNVIGLTLNANNKLTGYLNIDSKNQDEISRELVQLILKHKIDVFMPISYIEFHIAVPFITGIAKILKQATVLHYENVLVNKDYVDFFVATTPRQYADLIKLDIPVSRLITIPNPTTLYEVNRNKSDKIKIAFIGRISHPPKGVLFIPRIFSAIRKNHRCVTLKYLGGGQDLKALKMMHLVDSLKGRVEFTGRFHIEDIPILASDIDILIMPSKTEGFGIALIEAMSMGIVPIVTKIEGVTDWIVEDGVSGFVVDWNEESFVKKAEFLIENPKKRNEMALKARQKVAELFTVEIVSKSYSEFLEKVLNLPKIETNGLIPENLEYLKTNRTNKKMRFVPNFVKDIYKIINIQKTRF